MNNARFAPNSRAGLARGCVSFVVPPPVSPESSPERILTREPATILHSSDSDNGGIVSGNCVPTPHFAKRVTFQLRLAFNIQVMVPDSQEATCTAALEHFSVSPN